MKNKNLWIIAWLVLWVLEAPSLYAQYKKDFALKKITVDYLSKGHSGFQGFETRGLSGLDDNTSSGKWGKIEVQYLTQADWMNEVSITFYALTRSRVILQDVISQVNVPKGRSHYGVVFIHPRTLQRFGEIKRVAIRISYSGGPQDILQWPTKTRKEWWDQYPSISGYLKKIHETPFLLNDAGKYEDTR